MRAVVAQCDLSPLAVHAGVAARERRLIGCTGQRAGCEHEQQQRARHRDTKIRRGEDGLRHVEHQHGDHHAGVDTHGPERSHEQIGTQHPNRRRFHSASPPFPFAARLAKRLRRPPYHSGHRIRWRCRHHPPPILNVQRARLVTGNVFLHTVTPARPVPGQHPPPIGEIFAIFLQKTAKFRDFPAFRARVPRRDGIRGEFSRQPGPERRKILAPCRLR